MKKPLILTVLLLASGPAAAAFYDTAYLGRLIENCNALPDTFDVTPENVSRIKDCGLSTGYILGVFDALRVISSRSMCLPGTVTSEHIVSEVDDWIAKHPERAGAPADQSVNSALIEAWTCETGKAKP